MRTGRLYISRFLIASLPETRMFALKRALLRWSGVGVGGNVRICSSAKIFGNGVVSIGDNTWIGHDVLLVSGGRLLIGSNVDLAPRVFITTGTHVEGSDIKAAGDGLHREVVIGDGVWIGAGAIVLPGVQIDDGALIGAGSIVTRSISRNVIAYGSPARAKRMRRTFCIDVQK